MKPQLFITDTFTSIPFKGNPAATCFYAYEMDSRQMQLIATELGFPVTAFIKQTKSGNEIYEIRYFTITTEIPACGHGTLGASVMVFELRPTTEVTFKTIENISINVSMENGWVVMTYPKYELQHYHLSNVMLSSLGIENYCSAGYCKELETLFIEVENPGLLRRLQPDFNEMMAADNYIKEIVITSVSDIKEYDFLLRSFCPWIGINEDPVTGSVHSVLAGFWEEKTGKNELKAYQASERGGEVMVKSFSDRVEISGQCVVLMEGELNI